MLNEGEETRSPKRKVSRVESEETQECPVKYVYLLNIHWDYDATNTHTVRLHIRPQSEYYVG